LLGSRLRPLGIDVGKLWRGFPASIARLANEVCDRLADGDAVPSASLPPEEGDRGRSARGHFTPAQVPLIEGQYAGLRYAVPSAEGEAAIRLLAQTEAIFLDPVYTGKAFAGLLDLVERGAIGPDEPVIFLHTGGIPALFGGAQAGPAPARASFGGAGG
ncbi:MAG TPA: pyridoxal-phosphate dependent enzyme, partial [Anaerolineae bacterium]